MWPAILLRLSKILCDLSHHIWQWFIRELIMNSMQLLAKRIMLSDHHWSAFYEHSLFWIDTTFSCTIDVNIARNIRQVLANCADIREYSTQSFHSAANIIAAQRHLLQSIFWKSIKLSIQKYLAHDVAKWFYQKALPNI